MQEMLFIKARMGGFVQPNRPIAVFNHLNDNKLVTFSKMFRFRKELASCDLNSLMKARKLLHTDRVQKLYPKPGMG